VVNSPWGCLAHRPQQGGLASTCAIFGSSSWTARRQASRMGCRRFEPCRARFFPGGALGPQVEVRTARLEVDEDDALGMPNPGPLPTLARPTPPADEDCRGSSEDAGPPPEEVAAGDTVASGRPAARG